MSRYRLAYPPEFPRQMVDLVRSGRTPEEVSREFEPSAASIAGWVRRADAEVGRQPDVMTTAEREELARLRRENRQLRQERDILAKGEAEQDEARWASAPPNAGARSEGRPERAYERMRASQAARPIRIMARVLGVSASGVSCLARPATVGSA
jgi:transposase